MLTIGTTSEAIDSSEKRLPVSIAIKTGTKQLSCFMLSNCDYKEAVRKLNAGKSLCRFVVTCQLSTPRVCSLLRLVRILQAGNPLVFPTIRQSPGQSSSGLLRASGE